MQTDKNVQLLQPPHGIPAHCMLDSVQWAGLPFAALDTAQQLADDPDSIHDLLRGHGLESSLRIDFHGARRERHLPSLMGSGFFITEHPVLVKYGNEWVLGWDQDTPAKAILAVA